MTYLCSVQKLDSSDLYKYRISTDFSIPVPNYIDTGDVTLLDNRMYHPQITHKVVIIVTVPRPVVIGHIHITGEKFTIAIIKLDAHDPIIVVLMDLYTSTNGFAPQYTYTAKRSTNKDSIVSLMSTFIRTRQVTRATHHIHAYPEPCIPCQASVPETKREPLKMSPLPTAPWTEISVDFEELPNGQYLLVLMDDYSRFPIVEIVPSTSASVVIPRLDEVLS